MGNLKCAICQKRLIVERSKYVGYEGIQAVTVFGDLTKLKKFMAL